MHFARFAIIPVVISMSSYEQKLLEISEECDGEKRKPDDLRCQRLKLLREQQAAPLDKRGAFDGRLAELDLRIDLEDGDLKAT